MKEHQHQYRLHVINSESIHDLVGRDLEERKRLGLRTYGRYLTTDSPEDMLTMAYEEALDLCCYLRTEIEKQKHGEQALSRPEEESIPDRGEYTDVYISPGEWCDLLLSELLPRYLTEVGNHAVPFTLEGLRDWIESNYKYRDCHKRLSSAFKKLKDLQLVYSPSRYAVAVTGKFYVEYQSLYDQRDNHCNSDKSASCF